MSRLIDRLRVVLQFWILSALCHLGSSAWAATPMITAGMSHTCALSSVGAVVCWGLNSSGQLGDGTTNLRRQPVAVVGLSANVIRISAGDYHTCALLASGGVKCWGLNSSGQLGDNTQISRSTPIDVVGLASGVRQVTAGSIYNCALTTAATTMCWGKQGNATDFSGSSYYLSPARVDYFGSNLQDVVTGGNHGCALTALGGVLCGGENLFAQLGSDVGSYPNSPVAVPGLGSGIASIWARNSITCAQNTSGSVLCWGWGRNNFAISEPVTGMGPVQAFAWGLDAPSSSGHFCAIAPSGVLRCIGSNGSGQLGDGTQVSKTSLVDITSLSNTNKAVVAGLRHTCALSTAGAVYCWGLNSSGQVGDGNTSALRSSPSLVSGLGGTGTLNLGAVTVADTTPDPFSFASQTSLALSTVVTSNAITVTGIDGSASISIAGAGSYSLNGGSYTSNPGTVTNGMVVAIRMTSSASPATSITTTLSIGGVKATFIVTTAAGLEGVELAAPWIEPGETTELLTIPRNYALPSCMAGSSNVVSINRERVMGTERGDTTITCGAVTTTLRVRMPWVTDISPRTAVVGVATVFTVTGRDLATAYLDFQLPHCVGVGVSPSGVPWSTGLSLSLGSGLQTRQFLCVPTLAGVQNLRVNSSSRASVNFADRRLSSPAYSPSLFGGSDCAMGGACSVNFVPGGTLTDSAARAAVFDAALKDYVVNGEIPWWTLSEAQLNEITSSLVSAKISMEMPEASNAARQLELDQLRAAYDKGLADMVGLAAVYGYTWTDFWRPSMYSGWITTTLGAYSGKDWLQLSGGILLNGVVAAADSAGLGTATKATKFGKSASKTLSTLGSMPSVVTKAGKLAKKLNSAKKISAVLELGTGVWNDWSAEDYSNLELSLKASKIAGAEKLSQFLAKGGGKFTEELMGIAAGFIVELGLQAPYDALEAKFTGEELKSLGGVLADTALAATPVIGPWVDMGSLSRTIADRAYSRYFESTDGLGDAYSAQSAAVIRRHRIQNLIRLHDDAQQFKADAAAILPGGDVTCFFDWAEARLPTLLTPAKQATQVVGNYRFRAYPGTGIYFGLDRESVVAIGGVVGNSLLQLGTLSDFLVTARSTNCR